MLLFSWCMTLSFFLRRLGHSSLFRIRPTTPRAYSRSLFLGKTYLGSQSQFSATGKRITCKTPTSLCLTISLNVFMLRASLAVHLMFLSQYYDPSPFTFPCSFGNPSLVLTSNMAAYVYRNVRLGFYREHMMATNTAGNQPSTLSDFQVRAVSIALDKSYANQPDASSESSGHSHEEKCAARTV